MGLPRWASQPPPKPRESKLIPMLAVLLTVFVATFADLPEVRHLTGEPDFRDVTLRWEYARRVSDLAGFQVRYCELQAWGPHRCRTKMVPDTSGHDAMTSEAKVRMFSVIIDGLRMSTNYTFEVRPVEARRARSEVVPTRLTGHSIIVPTKGFSARATQCLPHASEVEVLTGPNFGGRIAVEAADGERCAVDGDPNSARDAYILRIDHERCGSHLNATTVATFVLVQENLPILTHSTRRFLVLCTYQPETLTVRAGINLPTNSREDPDSDNRLEQHHSEAIPFDDAQLESVNAVQMSRLQHNLQMVEERTGDIIKDQSVAQFVLMTILVVAGAVGCGIAAWWYLPGVKKLAQGSNVSDTSTSTSYENFENSLRDTTSIGGIETNSCDTDSLNTTQKSTQLNKEEEDDSTPGVFTIHIASTPRQLRQQSCITIEPTSHSEA